MTKSTSNFQEEDENILMKNNTKQIFTSVSLLFLHLLIYLKYKNYKEYKFYA
jgi:hypothetical protein